MQRPSNCSVTTPFGYVKGYPLNGGYHMGVDFSYIPDNKIYAPEDGNYRLVPNNGSLGNAIHMYVGPRHHAFGHTSQYLITDNQFCKRGTPIAIMGATGAAQGVHLHWALAINGGLVDPLTQVNESFIGGDMPVKTSLSTARILAEEVLGRDRGKTHAGGFDGDLNANHVNHDLTNEYIYQLWTSPEASAAQAVKDAKDSFYNTYKDKIAELSARPTKEELAKLGQELASEQAKVTDAEKKLAEEQAKKSSDTELLDQAGNWLTKLFNRLFKKG